MQKYLLAVSLFLIVLTTFGKKKVSCEIQTSMGNIGVELYLVKAPKTVANFLKYVDQKLYDGTNFYRVCTPANEKDRKIKIEVIQGGDVPESKQFSPVPMETTRETGIRHVNGAISMARDTPNSATSSFFICINNQPELDFAGKRNPDGQGFAAFGKVTRGMNVVWKIQAQENKDQYLVHPVEIISIRRMK